MTTTHSEKLIPFLTAKEGRVLKAYRDSGGVWTIGIGFTMLDAVFAKYWMGTRGHALRSGDTITLAECSTLLSRILAENYSPAVRKKFGDALPQWSFDGSDSVIFNCGAGALKDRWAQELAAGNIATAAALLKTTRVTARSAGRLEGLVRRRNDEARLIQYGDYGAGAVESSVSSSSAEIREYQTQLQKLKFYTGEIDGINKGLGSRIDGAIRTYQFSKKMTVDGKVGPATRASLERDVSLMSSSKVVAISAGGGGATQVPNVIDKATTPANVPPVTSPTTPDVPNEVITAFDWSSVGHLLLFAGVAAGVALGVFLLWRYRGVILRRRTPA